MSSSSSAAVPAPSSPAPSAATGSASGSGSGSGSASASNTDGASSSAPVSPSPPPPTSPSPSGSPSPSLPSSLSLSNSNSNSQSSASSASPSSTANSATAPSSSSATILTSPSMTVSQSTMIATSNGQTFTTIIQVTSTIAAGSTVTATANPVRRTSHTGAIVGGVIGGLALVVLAAGAFLWYRRRSRAKTDFDGNFDPASVGRPGSAGPVMIATGGTLPRVNLNEDEDDGMGGGVPHGRSIITPFTYAPAGSVFGDGSSRSQSPPVSSASPRPMSHYSDVSGHGYAPTMSSAGGYYAAVPQQTLPPGGYYPPAPPSSSGSSAYNPRSVKEIEVAGSRRSGGLAVANPSNDEQYQDYLRSGPLNARGGSQSTHDDMLVSPGASSASGGVIVHQDGGRVEPETVQEEEADEIPPTYDSIPSDERK